MTTLSKLYESVHRIPFHWIRLPRFGGVAAFLLAAIAASPGYGQSTSTTGDETTRGTQVYVYDRDEETGEFRRRTASNTSNTTTTQVDEDQPGDPTDETGETGGFEFEDATPAPAVGRIRRFETTPRDGVPPRGEAVPPISNAVPPLGNRQFGQPLNPPDIDPTVTVIGEPPNVENVDNGQSSGADQNRTSQDGTARRSIAPRTDAPRPPARANSTQRRTDDGSTGRFGTDGRRFDGRQNRGAIQSNQPIQDGARIQPGNRFGGNSRQFDAGRTDRSNFRGSQFRNGTPRPSTMNRTGTGGVRGPSQFGADPRTNRGTGAANGGAGGGESDATNQGAASGGTGTGGVRGPSQFGANPGTGTTSGGVRSGVSGGAASGGTGAAAGGGGAGGPR